MPIKAGTSSRWSSLGPAGLAHSHVEGGVHVDAVHVALVRTLQALDLKAGLADDARVGRAEGGRAPDDAPARGHMLGQRGRQHAGLRCVLPVHVVHQDHLRTTCSPAEGASLDDQF